jgi:hypothetical protein
LRYLLAFAAPAIPGARTCFADKVHSAADVADVRGADKAHSTDADAEPRCARDAL